MHIPPTFSINNHHRELLAELDHLQQRFLNISLHISLQRTIHHRTLMKSSLFSARIEGNPLSFTQLDEMSLKEKEHFLVFNILDAYASRMLNTSKCSFSFKDISSSWVKERGFPS